RMHRRALLRFFTHNYRPTPLLSPWNGGSGFYRRDHTSGIEAIEHSTAPRFIAYRKALALGRRLVGYRTEAPKKEDKSALVRMYRQYMHELCGEWLDTALVVTGTGRVMYPPLLGS